MVGQNQISLETVGGRGRARNNVGLYQGGGNGRGGEKWS